MFTRPRPARWMRLLAVNDDLPAALAVLARSSPVEPEGVPGESGSVLTPELAASLRRFEALAQSYRSWWPPGTSDGEAGASGGAESGGRPAPSTPLARLEVALETLESWRRDAQPCIDRYQAVRARESELGVLEDLAVALGTGPLQLERMTGSGAEPFCLGNALFVLPPEAPEVVAPQGCMTRRVAGVGNRFLLAVGPGEAMRNLAEAVSGAGGRPLTLPETVRGTGAVALPGIRRELADLRQESERIKKTLGELGVRHRVAARIRDVARLQWFFNSIRTVGAGEVFSRLGGWIGPDAGEREVHRLLEASGSRALVSISDAGPGNPPMVQVNPPWARPFEFFARLLGAPGAGEVDPSVLLALVAPLLFGFMFGDLGQGAVLFAAGYLLRSRFAIARMLMAGGAMAMLFGLLFGSLFCAETILPALWLHPTLHPMTVLATPLALGVALITIGLGFNGLEAFWQGHLHGWLRHDAGVIPIYLGVLLAFFHPAGWGLAGAGLAWFLAGNALDSPRALPGRLAHLAESLMQLGVNTLSFARVGAFALAHAGLSQAVITLAGLTDSPVVSLTILVMGNLLILLLEGLVVSVQTTRLILFEFFVRFLRCDGRAFRPLPPPPE